VTAPAPTGEPRHLRGGGASVVLAPSPAGVPTVLYWGADLGELSTADLTAYSSLRAPGVPHSALDQPRSTSVLPENTSGYTGTPAVEGWRTTLVEAAETHPTHTASWAPRFRSWQWGGEGSTAVLTSTDEEAGLAVRWHLELTDEGVVRVRTELTNTGTTPFVVAALRSTLPVPAEADELLDLTGRWCRERTPQRHRFVQGAFARNGRHGRTGHDATLVLLAGTPGFSFGSGSVWGVHVAWSGDHTTFAERTPEGECLLGGAELLGPGEVVLAPGESYAAPWLVGSCSDRGLDGLSDRLHRWLRARSPRTRRTRPVVLNTWEAVYFDHDLGRLTELADVAAEVGVERFVLDDGWFSGRRHDRAGLGDWTVDRELWPDGLHPIVDHVRGLGMEFGLWVEPEMVNEDSALAREHPDWLLRGRAALPDTWRHQQVLDLQHPGAYEHLRDALTALLDEYDIAFLKWDHNRDLIDVAHAGRPAVHGQTLAFYRLLDELRAAHPALEIESCASGGGRIDLGVLARTDRVWPSDTLDPLLRTDIQRWTSLLVAPELLGAHIGGPVVHTTGRSFRLGFRAAVALLGHFGIEWDLTRATAEEREAVAAWVTLHKEVRHLLAQGRLVRPDHPDPAVVVTGAVAEDRSEAVFVVAVTASPQTQAPTPVRLAGLDPSGRYRVEHVEPTTDRHPATLDPGWPAGGPVVTSGSLLMEAGLRFPSTAPESAYVLRLQDVDGRGRHP
jgi:alpha-galactosidase